MRNNNNNKLKAFVRFDGSGRIIPSSLIVQAFKPKVGNYKEIDANECCNGTTTTTTTNPSSTTTTSSSSTSTSTSTSTTTQGPVVSFIGAPGNAENSACGALNGTATYYTTGPLSYGIYPQNGNVIYFDQALTQPVTFSYIGSPGIGTILDCNNGVLSNQRSC
jgi:hypothetical protein